MVYPILSLIYYLTPITMSHEPSSLPNLIVNRSFISEFITADAPCLALGMVEEQNQQYGFLALRSLEPIPPEISAQGFNFGHCLMGNENYEVIHFSFEFYGFKTYNVVINPSNPIAKAVLKTMISDGDCFFFSLDETNGNATAFRTEIGQETLTYLKSNFSRIMNSTTSESQYRQALSSFSNNPDPTGILLNWVCRDDLNYLDLTQDRMEMTPA